MIKKIIFGIASMFLILDWLLIPFTTEPFVFQDGVDKKYVFGFLITATVWIYLVWLNFTDLHKIDYLSPIFSKSKESYYFHLQTSLRLITAIVIIIIFFGFYSAIEQSDLLLQNLLKKMSNLDAISTNQLTNLGTVY